MTIYAIGAEAMTWTYCSTVQGNTVGYDGSSGGNGPMMYIDSTAALIASTTMTEGWVRFNIQYVSGGTPASIPLISFFNSSTDKDAIRITWTGTNEFEVLYNSSGTTYTSLGKFYSSYIGSYLGAGICWDVYFKRGTSGIVRVFANNAMIFEYTGTLSTPDTVFDGVRFRGNDAIRLFSYGAVIFSDVPMFNSRLINLRPTGIGNETGWALTTFANVDDTAFKTDFEDGVYVNTTGAALTHAMADMTALTDRRYPAVIVYAHAAISAGATPTGMNFRIRQNTTNYTKGSLGVTPGEPPKGYSEIYTTDMTGAAWTAANINSLQVGLITT
ncbi:MAG: hypothetical protein ACKO0Z_07345 [Betaproteobacteria bacterium]